MSNCHESVISVISLLFVVFLVVCIFVLLIFVERHLWKDDIKKTLEERWANLTAEVCGTKIIVVSFLFCAFYLLKNDNAAKKARGRGMRKKLLWFRFFCSVRSTF